MPTQQHINTYGGLNQDTAFDSIQPNMYIDALDVRISTSDGESNGAITNIEGNSESFSIDQTGASGTKEIIGHCVLRNYIILFCADDSGTNGWIYYISYDEKSREINTPIVVPNVAGDPVLVYFNAGLNFKKANPIEAVGRFENNATQRIYWTDYTEFMRSLDIANVINAGSAATPITTPLGSIDIFPDVDYTQPLTTNITSGGQLLTGSYQFAYRLITEDGKQTLISPPGNLNHLVLESDSIGTTQLYMGDPQSTNTFKSIEITIATSAYNTIFKKLELIALFYETLSGTPEITSVETVNLDSSGTTKFIYTGAENTITTITTTEFAIKVYPFRTVKTMVPKDNSLVVANIKSSSFDVKDLLGPGETLDLQTKRYNSSAQLPFTNALTNPATGVNYTALDEQFNLPYNLDQQWEGYWHDVQQFKYQSNGTTLGGSSLPAVSPNLKYKFTINRQLIDDFNGPDPATGVKVEEPGYASLNNGNSETINLNDGYSHINKSFTSHASPYKSGLVRGYKRGETYRFGIIFYSKKGEASFVEYIGDIKFPDISDVDDTTTVIANSDAVPAAPASLAYFPVSVDGDRASTVATTHNTYGCDLGIEMTLDFTSCPILLSQIESYQIVRVPRTNNDKRRVQSGIVKVFSNVSIGAQNNDNGYDFQVSGNNNVLHMQRSIQVGNKKNMVWNTLNNEWNIATGSTNYTIKGNFLQFYSPEISYDFNKSTVSGDLGILITGAYDQLGTASLASDPLGASNSYRRTEDVNNPGGGELGTLLKKEFFKPKETSRIRTTSLGDYNGVTYPVSYRGVEYFKFIDSQVFTDADPINAGTTAGQEAIALKTYGPLLDTSFNQQYYLRNVIVDANPTLAPGAGGALNHPNGNTLTYLSRGASGLIISITNIKNNPYTNAAPIPYSTTTNFDVYPTGVSPKFGYVAPLNIIGSITGDIYQTPSTDLISFKQEIYGGYSQSVLENNVFFPCSPVIDKAQLNPKVFGGDTFISMFNFQENSALLDTLPYATADASMQFYNQTTSTITLPVETQVNTDLAYGATYKTSSEQYWTVSGGTPAIKGYLRQEEQNLSIAGGSSTNAKILNAYKDAYNPVYSIETNSSGIGFFVKPDTIDDGSEIITNDIRGYLSDVKINGEFLDSWTIFRSNNYYDVEADHGPINKIVNWKDEVYFFQDNGVGAYSINPRAVTTTTDGIPTELGSGQGFAHHQYLSTENGSIHQWGVKTTDTGIYYYDATHSKIFRVGEGNNPLSEIKGMHSFLNTMNGDVLLRKENGGDNPILGKGITMARDMINDEVLFSFHGRFTLRLVDNRAFTYYPGEYVYYIAGPDTFYFQVNTEFTTTTNFINNIALVSANCTQITNVEFIAQLTTRNNTTLVFDELSQSFSSLYSAVPSTYLENGNILLSPNPSSRANVFIHNKGNFGEFYGTVSESYVKLVINPNADINKILRFLEFNSTVRDKSKTIDRAKTITAFRVQTQYQDTNKVAYSAANVKRRFDKWRLKIPRDQLSTSKRGRLRSTFFTLTLYYDNTYNKELILNRIMSHYDIQVY